MTIPLLKLKIGIQTHGCRLYHYAEIALPTPLRTTFTYSIPAELKAEITAGKRVWIPFRNRMTIGVVVDLHNEKPEFKTLEINKALDSESLISSRDLKLFKWISRFYYCSLGEVIQAALPSGLNFISKEEVRLSKKEVKLTDKESVFISTIQDEFPLLKKDFDKRFNDPYKTSVIKSLFKKGVFQVWEVPVEKVQEKKVKAWLWAESKDQFEKELNDLFQKQKKVFKWMDAGQKLLDMELPQSQINLKEMTGIKAAELKKLESTGLIISKDLPESMFNEDVIDEVKAASHLNEDQQRAFNHIKSSIDTNAFQTYLLKGITGSGKTEVYIHALQEVLDQGRNGIVLVPEIALTPQFLSRFRKVFGDQLAVYHSRLNERERKEAWEQINENEKKVVIGTRSAIFMPVKEPGIIILDEEHDQSYKQEDPAPRYHAREIAMMKAIEHNSVVVLGSATPSMQALHMVHENKATLLELKKRHADAKLPEVEILDMTQYRGAMRGPLAVPLFFAIEKALSKKEQIILLQNRRGFSSYLQCLSCGHIPQSPETSVSLTYHKYRNMLLCHYSGYSRKADTLCEVCGSDELTAKGIGTQQVEEELTTLFPEARIIRMDRDTTSAKNSHSKIIQSFENGEADILLGTQLVTKGLDFPNVTVVGVIDADTELAFPSFQSTERSFQVLSQVSGRAGRAEKNGKVFIQTFQADQSPFTDVAHHNFDSFSEKEMEFRSVLNYPPFSRLVGITFKGKNEALVSRSAHIFTDILRNALSEEQILGPSPSSIQQIKGTYYWECSIKLPLEKGDRYIEHLFDKVFEHYNSNKPPASVRVNVNVGKVS